MTTLKHRGRQIIVLLVPPNRLAFRIKGTRQEYDISIEQCYESALRLHALRQYQQQVVEYKSGLRKRRPKKPFFSP